MDIQKLNDWAKGEREKALAECRKIAYDLNNKETLIPRKMYAAFSSIVSGAELLISTAHESNHGTRAHCANTMIGEVPQVNDSPQTDTAGAGDCETGSDQQNEQTQEVYPHPMDEACNECDTIPDEDGRCLCWGG